MSNDFDRNFNRLAATVIAQYESAVFAPLVVVANETLAQVRSFGFKVIDRPAEDKRFRRERERYLRRRRQTRATFHGR